MKKCTKCRTVKELTEFSPSQSQCKPCRRIPAKYGMNLVFPYIAGAPNFNKWGPKAFELIRKERERQIILWSENDFEHHDDHKILTILTEELGEIARAILEHDNDNLLEEITQLGALCSKWLEHILERSAQKEESDTQLDLTPCNDTLPSD